jgi:hypothetical protein
MFKCFGGINIKTNIKLLLMFTFIFLVIPFVKSEVSTIYYPQNQTADLKLPCWNNNTYCSSGAKCNITIAYGNDSLLVTNLGMTNTNGIFNYTLTPAQTSIKGIYKEYVICSDGMNNGYSAVQFYITGKGNPPANDGLRIFIYLIFVLSMIGLIYTFCLNLAKIITLSIGVYDVLLSWAFYILMIITFNLASEYMLSTFIENLSIFFLNITKWTNGVMPILLLAIAIMIKMLDKKGKLSANEMWKGGSR